MKKIALLLSGNIRRFFDKNIDTSELYKNLVKNQNIDIFIYTDNNDFYYDNIQYFSENNKEKTLGIPTLYEKRYHSNIKFINYQESLKLIKENLLNIFNDNLKDLYIEDYNSDLINSIYDKNNINHCTFMNNNYSNITRKKAIICQYYKLYKCYNLLINYENKNNIKYDIIIRSRFDLSLTNLNNYCIRSFDLSNKLYCYNYGNTICPCWAIGDRFIMDKYCNYYINISQNMIEQVYYILINNNWQIISNINIKDLKEKYPLCEDASDCDELGLVYLIKNKNNYGICHFDIAEVNYKLYN